MSREEVSPEEMMSVAKTMAKGEGLQGETDLSWCGRLEIFAVHRGCQTNMNYHYMFVVKSQPRLRAVCCFNEYFLK